MVSGQFQWGCFCFVTTLLTVVAPVELSFSADEERLPALVEQFCAHHAVRRGPCASLVSHAESLRTAAAAAREAIVRFDVAIVRYDYCCRSSRTLEAMSPRSTPTVTAMAMPTPTPTLRFTCRLPQTRL